MNVIETSEENERQSEKLVTKQDDKSCASKESTSLLICSNDPGEISLTIDNIDTN